METRPIRLFHGNRGAMDEQENLAQLNDRLQAKNHALAQALTRAGEELAKA